MNRTSRNQYHRRKKGAKSETLDSSSLDYHSSRKERDVEKSYEGLKYSQRNIEHEVDYLEQVLEESKENVRDEIQVLKESNARLSREIEKMSRRQQELAQQQAKQRKEHQRVQMQWKKEEERVQQQNHNNTTSNNHRRYIRGIDGLRTLAVLGVILYHLLPASMKGGYLGVTLFFVISGYLMTDIIYTQIKNNTFSFKTFYMRRIRRLLPAVAILFLVCGAFIPYINSDFLVHFRSVVTTSLLNINNWWQLATGGDYFDRFAEVAPFENLWSLSVEGQFYLIYPLIFVFLLKKLGVKWSLCFLSVATILSSAEMSWLYDPKNVTRVYYGTDTRLFSLLMGAIIALIIREYGEKIYRVIKGKFGTLLGLTTVMLTIWSFISLADQSAFLYKGGMVLFSFIDMLLLLLVVMNERVEQWFIHPFFKWCGSRSYEIYLWQYPVITIMDKLWQVGVDDRFEFTLVKLAVIILLAEGTHRLVMLFYHFLTLKNERGSKKAIQRYLPAITATAIVACLFTVGFYKAPTKLEAANNQLEKTLKENEKKLAEAQKKQKQQPVKQLTPQQKLKQSTAQQIKQSLAGNVQALPLNEEQRKIARTMKVTAIGDSVLLNASVSLNKLMPNMIIDATVGRQILDAFPMIDQLSQTNKLSPIVLIALGTNGPTYDEADFDRMMKQLKDKKVFFVNTKSNLYWQDEVNQKLLKATRKYRNARIIDWYELSKNQPTWFGDDGTHMIDKGSRSYAEFIVKNLIAYS